MNRIGSIAFVVSAFVTLEVNAQIKAPNVENVIPNDANIIKQPALDNLGGELVQVVESGAKTYFVPRPVPDWNQFEKLVADKCSDGEMGTTQSVDLKVAYWSDELRKEIIEKADLTLETSDLHIIPHFAHTPVVRLRGERVLIDISLVPRPILNGEAVVAFGSLNTVETYSWADNCANLTAIANEKVFEANFHAQAHPFKRDRATAESRILATSDIATRVKNKESEVDRSSVNVKGKSSGFGIKLGPVSLGSGKSGFKTATENEHYRVVNRSWVSDAAKKSTSEIKVETVCETPNCDLSKTVQDFIFQRFPEQRATITQQADASWQLAIGVLKAPVEVVNLDQSVKAKLDSLLKMSSDKEVEVPIKGVPVKVKKKDATTITLNGDTDWTRKGQDWIPTSFSAHLIDTARFEDDIRVSFSKTLLDPTIAVVYASRQVPNIGPAGFVDEDFQQRLIALENNSFAKDDVLIGTFTKGWKPDFKHIDKRNVFNNILTSRSNRGGAIDWKKYDSTKADFKHGDQYAVWVIGTTRHKNSHTNANMAPERKSLGVFTVGKVQKVILGSLGNRRGNVETHGYNSYLLMAFKVN